MCYTQQNESNFQIISADSFVSALLLLYDVTNKTSFDNIRAWLGEIKEYAQDDVVIMLLGKEIATLLLEIGSPILYCFLCNHATLSNRWFKVRLESTI